jgi:hypothetical protein
VADTLALEALYNAVVARFTAEGSPVLHTFGWREPNRQTGAGNRVVWRPGDDGGNAGELGPPRNPGRNPRPLATLREIVTIYIQGHDATSGKHENELAQWKATRLLYDAVVRAIYLAAHGTYEILSTAWEIDKNERRYGATLVLILAIESMIPDAELTPAPVDVSAEIDDALDDVEETIEAP